MVCRSVILVLLIVACVYAAPVPDNPKFTLVKDSSFGFGAAGAGGKTNGVHQANESVEAPFPGNTGDKVPDVTVLDNVNTGAAFAFGNSISSGVFKNNLMAGRK